jgi:hypothetical protein
MKTPNLKIASPPDSKQRPGALRRPATWLIVSSVLNVALLAGLVSVALNYVSLPPFIAENRGGAIITAPDGKAWKTTVLLFNRLGNGPKYTTSNTDVTRAFMRNGEIINLPTPELHAKLGLDVVASRYFVVQDPGASARQAAAFLKDRGYSANIIIDAERQLNRGAMAVVTSNAFPHWALVLRKNGPNMGEPLQPWSWLDFADQMVRQ